MKQSTRAMATTVTKRKYWRECSMRTKTYRCFSTNKMSNWMNEQCCCCCCRCWWMNGKSMRGKCTCYHHCERAFSFCAALQSIFHLNEYSNSVVVNALTRRCRRRLTDGERVLTVELSFKHVHHNSQFLTLITNALSVNVVYIVFSFF